MKINDNLKIIFGLTELKMLIEMNENICSLTTKYLAIYFFQRLMNFSIFPV